MAAFLAVSMAVQTLYLLADLYWVGRLGKEAIAAACLNLFLPWRELRKKLTFPEESELIPGAAIS